MKKKRLISVMLASLMTAGVAATATGCDDIEEGKGFKPCYDVYIVLEDNQNKVIHKGDLIPMNCDDGKYAWGSGFSEINLDCGKNYITNADCYIYRNKPIKNEDYDNVCEDCFSLDGTLTN